MQTPVDTDSGGCVSASDEKRFLIRFLPGDGGEFEVMAFHKSAISLLKEGKVIVDQEQEFPLKRGIMRFRNEELVILAEEENK